MNKRYYWLKLNKNFFKRHDIRIIEDMENGKDFILFYMKILLESIDHNGYLRFNENIPYNEKMLATITNTEEEIVKKALKILKELHLIEVKENKTIYMTQTDQMTGTETEWAAKKRQYRENKRQQKDTKKTKKDNVRQEKEKEIDKEIEIDKTVGRFQRFWRIYPKKIGKQKCMRWFKQKNISEVLTVKIIHAIIKQKQTQQWKKDNGQFIPHPYTWLNQGRWEDEVEQSRWDRIEGNL